MPGMHLGPCGPLVIVSGCLAIGAGVLFVLEMVMSGGKGGSGGSDGSKGDGSSADPEHAHGGSQAKVWPTA
jgi:hypothetical protein